MYGFFQTTFYFANMGECRRVGSRRIEAAYRRALGIFSAALGILTGTVGYISAASFVHRIYSQIKLD